jgi:hypothetical protein
VNSTRAADGYKEFLQVFDVCTIAVDGNTRGATDKRSIPVVIAAKITNCRYKCLTKVGYLVKTQERSFLEYKLQLTG